MDDSFDRCAGGGVAATYVGGWNVWCSRNSGRRTQCVNPRRVDGRRGTCALHTGIRHTRTALISEVPRFEGTLYYWQGISKSPKTGLGNQENVIRSPFTSSLTWLYILNTWRRRQPFGISDREFDPRGPH